MKRDDIAARVGRYLWQERGGVVGIGDIMAATNLSQQQISGAEQSLKRFVADHVDEFQGYVLYIAIGNSGDHGFIQESLWTLKDQVASSRYMMNRAATEIAYTSQAADRVADDQVSAQLRRALRIQQSSSAIMEEVVERLSQALAESDVA
jgi:hypothetical protein